MKIMKELTIPADLSRYTGKFGDFLRLTSVNYSLEFMGWYIQGINRTEAKFYRYGFVIFDTPLNMIRWNLNTKVLYQYMG